MSLLRTVAIVIVALWLGAPGVHTQQPPPGPRPTLYLVSNSHLDTQWNWTVQDTIRQLVPATFYDNFALFDRFPDYTFNFEGAIHYMWFKEYHADAWPRLRKYVADGRWRLSGSWVNAADTNLPSPEALMRQALYGKRFYRQEFGRVSRDIYLPDCFGFGFALPSIGAHSGLEAFSMQKLSWGAAKPTPFAVGLWKGVDGSSLVASLRGGDYVAQVTSDISVDPKWNADLVTLADGHKVGFRYFGVGDQGGAPDAVSVEWVEKAIKNTGGAVEVRNTSADQLARDLTDAQRVSLPVYEGELLLKTHGVGCYTSQAAMKAFNRRNEQLADAAGWREGRVPARAARLNQPLVAFQAQAHPGALGRSLGLIDVSDTHDQIAVRAFKKAEDSEELIVRVQELYGRPVSGVQVSLPTGILNAREVNAAEEPVGEARVAGGKLTFNLTAYQPRTFAVTPDAPAARVAAVASSPLDLPFNLDGISTEANRADGDFDGRGRTYPAEQLPRTFSAGAVAFRFGPVAAAAPNAVAARGQRIALPAGTFNRVYILASSVGGDQKSMVTIERRRAAAARVPLNVQEWTGAIGQWDSRLRDDRLLREVFIPKMNDDQSWPLETIESQMLTKWIAPPKPAVGATAASPAAAAAPAKATPLSSPAGVSGLNLVRPGFVKRDEVAWVATHRHSPEGDEPYIFGYVFRYAIDLPQGATAIVLPLNDRIRVFAMTAANEPTPPVRAATVLYAPDLGAVPTARR